MGYLQVFTNAIVVALMAMYVYENQRRNGDVSARLDRIEKELDLEIFSETDIRKLVEIEDQQIAVTRKIAEIENQQPKNSDKGVTYIRWGKTQCDGHSTETIYSGQVGGGHYSHSGASVNYICLPNNPHVAQPLKLHDNYAYLYGAEYQIFDFNQPQGIRSAIGDHDVACAACLAKGKISSIIIPGKILNHR
ncbi:unnamed protein product [Mytilus coruscus]|uniref:Uncharacterized protein n=1 Tax=Mytilus coruscus TaxID=42192 RepID=A0A6J8AJI7_MYTCO|nr:unnamed protein product [Mytilus coruscus]